MALTPEAPQTTQTPTPLPASSESAPSAPSALTPQPIPEIEKPQ